MFSVETETLRSNQFSSVRAITFLPGWDKDFPQENIPDKVGSSWKRWFHFVENFAPTNTVVIDRNIGMYLVYNFSYWIFTNRVVNTKQKVYSLFFK